MKSFELAVKRESVGDEMLMVRYQRDANVAAEVFMLDHCTALRYNDLMRSVDDTQLSSTSLLSYLDTRRGREGIIDKYRRANESHFDRFGKWQARYIFDFWQFVKEQLTSYKTGGMLRDKRTVTFGQNSLSDPAWMEQMMSVSSLRLLEYLYDANSLVSHSARNAIRTIRLVREAIDSLGATNNRTAKRNGAITRHEADQHHQQAVAQMQSAINDAMKAILPQERQVLDMYETFFLDRKSDLMLVDGGATVAIR